MPTPLNVLLLAGVERDELVEPVYALEINHTSDAHGDAPAAAAFHREIRECAIRRYAGPRAQALADGGTTWHA